MKSYSRLRPLLLAAGLLGAAALTPSARADGQSPAQAVSASRKMPPGTIFASSATLPGLQFPETVIADDHRVYVSTYNFVNGTDNHIFVFTDDGRLVGDIGATPDQEQYLTNGLLGMAIEPKTGDLFVAANGTGKILRIQGPDSAHPRISVYATYPPGGGPEDLAFSASGLLYANDSNLGVVYLIPRGGGTPRLLIGPPGSGAPVSDDGLLQSPVPGLSPNGIGFSPDGRTLYLTNTYTDSVIAFEVSEWWPAFGRPRVLARLPNDDLEERPTGFDALVLPDTKFGASASTPINGPDGLRVAPNGDLYVASILGDNITILSPSGRVKGLLGTSAVTAHGLLNASTSAAFVGDRLLVTNLSIFTALDHDPSPFTVVAYNLSDLR